MKRGPRPSLDLLPGQRDELGRYLGGEPVATGARPGTNLIRRGFLELAQHGSGAYRLTPFGLAALQSALCPFCQEPLGDAKIHWDADSGVTGHALCHDLDRSSAHGDWITSEYE